MMVTANLLSDDESSDSSHIAYCTALSPFL